MPGTVHTRSAVLPLQAASLLPATAPGKAQPEPGGGPRCVLHKDDLIEPGLTFAKAAISYRTPGTTPISCTGELAGHRLTKPGTFSESGHGEEASCLGGAGTGTFTIVLPIDGRSWTITKNYTFEYAALPGRGGLLGGKLSGDGFTGTFDMFPIQGDCIARPMTRIHTVDNIEFEPTG